MVTLITPASSLVPGAWQSLAMHELAALAPLSGEDLHSATHMYLEGCLFSKT